MEPTQQAKKFPVKLVIIGTVLLIGIIFGYKKISFAVTHETTDNAQIETQITPVLPRVSGYVKKLTIQDFDSVLTNQLLVEIDDAELQSQLSEMEADYVQTEADITNANASLQNAIVSLSVNKGNIDVSNVKLQQSLTEYNRNKNLFAEHAITERQLDDSKYNYQSAQKAFDNSKNDLTSAQSKIAVLESMVKKNEATLKYKKTKVDEVKLKITYTKIYAPSSGKIGKKNVAVGQFVQAGAPLFSVVNDTTYWVTANFKENQLKSLVPGKEVEIEIDAYPEEKITGIIESLSEATGAKFAMLPPDNSSGNFVKVTQRVPVKIKIKNIEKYKHLLRAGLSVFVSATIK